MHPELFELKALVAGRLDTHRRREIDDHLGSCADCSRHYVAMMLGSASPKTAEAEARQGLVPSGAGAALSLVGGGSAPAPVYGIDMPLAPSAPPRPARPPHNNLIALETEFPATPARTQMPVSPSLVDAISKLRAESEAPQTVAAAAPVVPTVEVRQPQPPVVAAAPATPVVRAAAVSSEPAIIAPVAESPFLAPSIFTPTPYDGVSLIHPATAPAPAPVRPQPAPKPAPELIVTFSSTPRRNVAQRSAPPAPAATVAPAPVIAPTQEFTVQPVPTVVLAPAAEFELSTPVASEAPVSPARSPRMVMALVAAVVVVAAGIGGVKYFKSSVSEAATAAAAAATKQAQAASVRTAAPAAAAAAPQVETRIVYVDRPSSRKSEPTQTKPETVLVAPAVPIAVTLPEVNLNTGSDAVVQSSTQRSATSELTRSARATASRTAAPRP